MTVLYIAHMVNIMRRVKENRVRREREEKEGERERRRKLTTSYVYTKYREEEVGGSLGGSPSSLAMARWRRKMLRRERSLSMPTLSGMEK